MKVFLTLVWTLVLGGVILGAIILITGMTAAASAPQEAVIISLALACAILPYCFARALTQIANVSKH